MLETLPSPDVRTKPMSDKIRIGVLGASGYTGADLVRLALLHPNLEIAALTASSHAGKAMAEVFPHFSFVELPKLTTVEDADWSSADAVFCGLPHGTTQEITRSVLERHPQAAASLLAATPAPECPAAWHHRVASSIGS